jgi:hypothetical protein
VLCHEPSLPSVYRRFSVFQFIFVGVRGLGIIEVQKKMIETQRHKDTKVIKSLINIVIIKLYADRRNLFGNSGLKVDARVLLVISLKLKNLF